MTVVLLPPKWIWSGAGPPQTLHSTVRAVGALFLDYNIISWYNIDVKYGQLFITSLTADDLLSLIVTYKTFNSSKNFASILHSLALLVVNSASECKIYNLLEDNSTHWTSNLAHREQLVAVWAVVWCVWPGLVTSVSREPVHAWPHYTTWSQLSQHNIQKDTCCDVQSDRYNS